MDIPLDDPEANRAAAKIQAGFRGHMTRKKLKPEDKAEGEEVSSAGGGDHKTESGCCHRRHPGCYKDRRRFLWNGILRINRYPLMWLFHAQRRLKGKRIPGLSEAFSVLKEKIVEKSYIIKHTD